MSAGLSVCVTGAAGFVGAHVVRLMVERGHEVRGTYRGGGEDRLRELGAEPVRADVLDRDAIDAAVRGTGLIVHCAGAVGSPPSGSAWEANTAGPARVVEAAARAGIERVVVTSSVLALGFAPPGRTGDEEDRVESRVPLVYPESKREGDRGALEAGRRLGVEVVVVHPGYVLGPPVRPEDSGGSSRVVCQYLRGRLPAVVGGDTNLVDVRDVAEGHVLAAERGRPGERYVLGGHDIAWADLIERLAERSGVRHPVFVLPPAFATAARAGERARLPMPMPAETLTLMGGNTRFSSRKAERDLGYRARPLDETLGDTVDWCTERIRAGMDASESSALSRMSAMIQRAGAAGALGPVHAAERRFGRRLIAGSDGASRTRPRRRRRRAGAAR
ncbi:MAG TPA: NAD-dependent epimerase/dehydratase family protein [Thermoleophilaceae bacterium]|jgi:dihydroflavonol-4-reductase